MPNPVASYWLPPHQEVVPSTGCAPTGRVATFFQLPKREWSCPNEYPTLPQHPVYGMYTWWNPRGLGSGESPQSADITGYIRSISPGWGAAGTAGFVFMALGGTVALAGLTYWLVKRLRKNPDVEMAVFHSMGPEPIMTKDVFKAVKAKHPEVRYPEVEDALASLARKGAVWQSARSGWSGRWKKAPEYTHAYE